MSNLHPIALYGGSFNPPHNAHVEIIRYLLDERRSGLDPQTEIRVIPTWGHPFGKNLASFEHRWAMCERAFCPLGERVRLNDIEARLGGESRTVDTVAALMRAEPGRRWLFVAGADILEELQRWKEPERLRKLVDLVVLPRIGHEGGTGNAPPDISSTEIRAAIAAGDAESVRDLMPPPVFDYIVDRGLYRQPEIE